MSVQVVLDAVEETEKAAVEKAAVEKAVASGPAAEKVAREAAAAEKWAAKVAAEAAKEGAATKAKGDDKDEGKGAGKGKDKSAAAAVMRRASMAPKVWKSLQPYVLEPATVCSGYCNPICWRLQPYALDLMCLCASPQATRAESIVGMDSSETTNVCLEKSSQARR